MQNTLWAELGFGALKPAIHAVTTEFQGVKVRKTLNGS
jgi:hypothetical protein